jgi:beta-RFAP synthase
VTPASVRVEAPARLHFGLLDLGGSLGRRFGGIGAPAPGVGVRLGVSLADTLTADGKDADRAIEFARRFLSCYQLPGGAHVRIDRAIPAHCGLGSGTQLALSVARALAELHGLSATAPDLARAVGRAQRSAVGTWTFAGGGLVVEGGRPDTERDRAGPLLTRLPVPDSWRCVLVLPNAQPGVSGAAEAEAFARLPAPPDRDAARVAHLVLMAMLPALVEDDIDRFGAALTAVQEINGRWFAPAQGGLFSPGLPTDVIRSMRARGAPGVGQSSWGPAVYAVVRGDTAAEALASSIRSEFENAVAVYAGSFPRDGAVVTRS